MLAVVAHGDCIVGAAAYRPDASHHRRRTKSDVSSALHTKEAAFRRSTCDAGRIP